MNTKKFFCLVLSCLMVVGMVTGCSNHQPEPTKKNITDPRDYDEPVQDGRNEREEYGDEEIDAEDIGNDVL